MALISLQDIHIAFGGPALLDGVTLQIEAGERICLVGRNGEGKSTLLRIIHGEIRPDLGEVVCDRSVRTAYLPQDVPRTMEGTVYDVVARNWDHEHELDYPVERTISMLDLDPEQPFSALSGGMRRRDLLILDEPTNHLDIEAIEWLENFLLRRHGTLLFVTHDRVFLQKLATRIIELDRGRLTSWACDYGTYLQRRQALLDAEEGQWAGFDKKLAQEEQWIRQGIKARRTRNEGRVRALEAMRRERARRRERTGSVTLQQQDAERSGHKVIVAEGISHAYGDAKVIRNFSAEITRGNHIGIIGPNGCGKTTLINILLGQLPPCEGEVTHGTRLEIAFFDQHRIQLDETRTVRQNLCGDDEFIATASGRQHAIGYLRNFLFSPEAARQPVSSLSGGERNRLMLAKLFARPSNVMVLDEPTNDLDIETLDLLEEMLAEYPGTVLLVSHDRAFLNHVVTETLVFEGDGRINRYVGGYDDWVTQRLRRGPEDAGLRKKDAGQGAGRDDRAAAQGKTGVTRKRSNKERAELEHLPSLIEQLEKELHALHGKLNDPAFYRGTKDDITSVTQRMDRIPGLIEEAYARWTELES